MTATQACELPDAELPLLNKARTTVKHVPLAGPGKGHKDLLPERGAQSMNQIPHLDANSSKPGRVEENSLCFGIRATLLGRLRPPHIQQQ
jgi:hypothetical protein